MKKKNYLKLEIFIIDLKLNKNVIINVEKCINTLVEKSSKLYPCACFVSKWRRHDILR